MPRITLTLAALCALGLDDTALVHERGLTTRVGGTKGRRLITITGDDAAIRTTVDDIYTRGIVPDAHGFDQTPGMRAACRAAWPKVRDELAEQGYRVEPRGPYSTIRLTKES